MGMMYLKIAIFIRKHLLLFVVGIIFILLLFLVIPYILYKLLSNCDNSLDDYYGSMLGALVTFSGVILSLSFSKKEIRKEKKNDLINSLRINDYKSLSSIIFISSNLSNTCVDVADNVLNEFDDNYISAVRNHGFKVSAKQELGYVVNKLNHIIHRLQSYRNITMSQLKQIINDDFFNNKEFNKGLSINLQNYDNIVKTLHKENKILEMYLDDYNVDENHNVNEYSRYVKDTSKYINRISSVTNKIGTLISNRLNNLKSNVMNSIIHN